MRLVIQRVAEAAVRVDDEVVGAIDRGLAILVGCAAADSDEDIAWLAGKVARLRIFADDAGKMNRSVVDIDGGLLAVSQFTLHAATRKGNRPSFVEAAPPDAAVPLYERFVARLAHEAGRPVATGRFAAHMHLSLVNDGPVTICMDSQRRE